jgi:cell division protein FtsQ
MNFRILKILILLLLVSGLTAFSIIKNGDRNINFDRINYMDSDLKFISVKSVNKLLKQTDSNSSALLKRNLNLKKIEEIINDNAFIDFAEVSMNLLGELEIKIVERKPVFRVLNGEYYIDKNGDKMPLSNLFSERIPLIIGSVNLSDYLSLGSLGSFLKNDDFLNTHITGLEVIDNNLLFHVRNFSYVIKMKGFNQYKIRLKNYKVFYKSVLNDSILKDISSINLNFNSQVIVEKK